MFQPRPHQLAAVTAIEDAFRAGIRRPLVDMCVGSGKSHTFAMAAAKEIERGGTALICAHTRELVEQNAKACRDLGLRVGINAAALGERCWRAPVISCAIQSIFKYPERFGPVSWLGVDEAHLVPHSEAGMYRALDRALNYPRMPGGSGTVFRLQGGSLTEGEGAPFDDVVFRYGILDGIRDGYLVPAFSAPAADKMDPTALKRQQGEYTGSSQDAQMMRLMDSHIAQMLLHGANRQAWLIFEASTTSARAMAKRMNEWGIPTGLVLGDTPAVERSLTIEAFRCGRLRALVNVAALTTGFDVQQVDLLVMRRRTKSLGLYIQMVGRLLRTIGGNILTSIAAGKPDGMVLDFAGNIDEHGPLDFLFPKLTKLRMVSCESCNARVPGAARTCWSCDAVMTKLCPACLVEIEKGMLDCPHCGHDMRAGTAEDGAGTKTAKLSETPSGSALIAAYSAVGPERSGGWLPVMRVFGRDENAVTVAVAPDGATHDVSGPLADHARVARWIRVAESGLVDGLLLPNGRSRNTALQVGPTGAALVVPMPAELV